MKFKILLTGAALVLVVWAQSYVRSTFLEKESREKGALEPAPGSSPLEQKQVGLSPGTSATDFIPPGKAVFNYASDLVNGGVTQLNKPNDCADWSRGSGLDVASVQQLLKESLSVLGSNKDFYEAKVEFLRSPPQDFQLLGESGKGSRLAGVKDTAEKIIFTVEKQLGSVQPGPRGQYIYSVNAKIHEKERVRFYPVPRRYLKMKSVADFFKMIEHYRKSVLNSMFYVDSTKWEYFADSLAREASVVIKFGDKTTVNLFIEGKSIISFCYETNKGGDLSQLRPCAC